MILNKKDHTPHFVRGQKTLPRNDSSLNNPPYRSCYVQWNREESQNILASFYPQSSGDPPDCIVFDRRCRPVAVEVTEFVSRKAIEEKFEDKERSRKMTQQDSIYRDWSLNEVVEKLNNIIRNKDGKTFKGGPYAKTILVIHTDEFRLLIDREGVYERDLPSQSFGPVKQIDEAHLLFSYEPGVGSPYIKLPLNRP